MTYAWGLGEAFGYYMVGWESKIVARMLHPYRFIGIGSIDLSQIRSPPKSNRIPRRGEAFGRQS
ncbi:MAG: hypothetical protein HC789_18540 [Microcoleus sp. CSU_2_2]|nr:hypothetical protein [Microcoleus sp. CSU_2_2]